jgi:hypothetical protein
MLLVECRQIHFQNAIDGGEGNMVWLILQREYSGSPAANLANYYAGIIYLNLKDYHKKTLLI